MSKTGKKLSIIVKELWDRVEYVTKVAKEVHDKYEFEVKDQERLEGDLHNLHDDCMQVENQMRLLEREVNKE